MSDVLLIHGACHGAWCWDGVASHLSESGHRITAVELPSEDPDAGLVEYAETAIGSLPGPPDDLVVVGHSLGALTAAVVADRVETRRLVFVAGIISSPGMSLADLATVDAERDGHVGKGGFEFREPGLFRFTRAGAMRTLFHDCDPEKAELAQARLRFQRSMWNEVANFDDWRAEEIVSIVCADDRVVNPEWGRKVSRERLGVEATVIDGGHSPWLSRPAELAQMLIE
jgi:pimeloyl-ACP methyl ester carboxylesterase